MDKSVRRFAVALAGAAISMMPPTAQAAELTNQGQASINIAIVPTASLTFVGSSLLALEVPPSKSTVNTSGAVHFIVAGNASATLRATPDAFVSVPSQGWMGKAVLGGGSVGYQIQLTFPSSGVAGSPVAIATLPLFAADGTVPPLTVPLPLTSGQRPGTIDLLASADWTPDGGLPLAGVYVGAIVITVTADNL